MRLHSARADAFLLLLFRAAQLIGLKAKIYAKKRHAEKVVMKKTIAEHSERDNKRKAEEVPKGAVPHYLLDREQARGACGGRYPRALCLLCSAVCSALLCVRVFGRGLNPYDRILLLRGSLWAMRILNTIDRKT
jgi:hypothetical protein